MLCHVRKPQLTEMGKAMPIQFMTRQIYKTKFGVFVPPQESLKAIRDNLNLFQKACYTASIFEDNPDTICTLTFLRYILFPLL
jgi:hypothetical protein